MECVEGYFTLIDNPYECVRCPAINGFWCK